MNTYPDMHLAYMKMRCEAKTDEYGRMTGSETKYEFYKMLVSDLIDDKYSRKQRLLSRDTNKEEIPYLLQKDPLSEKLLMKVKRVVDILFQLSIEDMFIVEKSYLLLDEIVHLAKDEGSKQIVHHFDNNPEPFNFLTPLVTAYLSPKAGHIREMAKDRNEYSIERLFPIATSLACMPVLEELFQKDHDRLVDYCRKYRHEVYVEVENHRALLDL